MGEQMAGFANEDSDPAAMPGDAGRRVFLRQAAIATTLVWGLPAIKGLGSATAFARMTPAPERPPKKPDLKPPVDEKPIVTDKPPVEKAPEVVKAPGAAAPQPEVALPKTGVETSALLGASAIALTGGVAALRTTRPGASLGEDDAPMIDPTP